MQQSLRKALEELREGVAATKRMLLERCEMREDDGQFRSVHEAPATRGANGGEGVKSGGGVVRHPNSGHIVATHELTRCASALNRYFFRFPGLPSLDFLAYVSGHAVA